MPQPDGPSLPRYHRRVTEDRTVVLVVPLNSPLETRTLIDSWLSCCLQGSPSLLCFFVDTDGICRGCRFVLAADIPHLEEIAKAYRVDEQRCLVDEDASSSAFDPTVLREASHSLLEALVHRCDRDGGHFLLVPGPLGPRLFAGPEPDDECEDEVSRVPGLLTLPSLSLSSLCSRGCSSFSTPVLVRICRSSQTCTGSPCSRRAAALTRS
ncbi:EDRF1 [Symbiodinium microadriaticum]|nr:EDRF1 [Symbiodinium microadriaticum]